MGICSRPDVDLQESQDAHKLGPYSPVTRLEGNQPWLFLRSDIYFPDRGDGQAMRGHQLMQLTASLLMEKAPEEGTRLTQQYEALLLRAGVVTIVGTV